MSYAIPCTFTHAFLNVHTQDYWDPGESELEIYRQITSINFKQIEGDTVHLEELLGKGQFGEVYRGWWNNGERMVEVALKRPKQGASGSNAKIKLLQEAAILGQFKHPRVTKVYGIVLQSDPVRMTGTCMCIHCICLCSMKRTVLDILMFLLSLLKKQYNMQVMMIMEYLHNGDLCRHLNDIRQK